MVRPDCEREVVLSETLKLHLRGGHWGSEHSRVKITIQEHPLNLRGEFLPAHVDIDVGELLLDPLQKIRHQLESRGAHKPQAERPHRPFTHRSDIPFENAQFIE